jgi:hypothetical protein
VLDRVRAGHDIEQAKGAGVPFGRHPRLRCDRPPNVTSGHAEPIGQSFEIDGPGGAADTIEHARHQSVRAFAHSSADPIGDGSRQHAARLPSAPRLGKSMEQRLRPSKAGIVGVVHPVG